MIPALDLKRRRRARTIVPVLLMTVAALAAGWAHAADEETAQAPAEKAVDKKEDGRLYLAPLLAPKAPVVDGRLNEEGWSNAVGIERLHLAGSPKLNPSRATEVYVTIDDSNLFVAFRCGEPYPERRKRAARPKDVDAIAGDDAVIVQLEPTDDTKAAYYEITVSSNGALALAQRGSKTKTWNAGGIQAAVRDALGGWVAEVRVPFKAMGRGMPGAGEVWRANFVRHIASVEPAEYASWAVLPAPDIHQPENFGELRFE